MKKIILLIAILSLSANSYALIQKIEVLGMVCAFCAQGIEKSFSATDSVNDVYVSLENYFVAIESKDGLDNKFITKVISDAGYDVRKIENFSGTMNQIRIENEK
jgi:copper chaperone CopZ|tara:strand:- start:20 stop:331 length:312 start_codon:yes stop_codon:yes gene_type:complete